MMMMEDPQIGDVECEAYPETTAYIHGKGRRTSADIRGIHKIPGICHGYLPISRGMYPNPNPH